MNVGIIRAFLTLKDIGFKAGLAKASAGIGALQGKLNVAGKKLKAWGAAVSRNFTMPLLAIGGASLKLAADFETGMTKIVTLVGVSAGTVEGWKTQVLDISRETGVAAKSLADGLFFITSAGLRGEKAMEALTASSKASALGLGEVETIADAVTSAMNAYGQENLSATRATNIMALAIREGKLEASQLAPVLGRLLPTASAMGVEFEQVAGILAVMSRTGLDAAEASTSLSSIMTTLLKPTNQARKALDKVGLSHSQLRETAAGSGGLIEVMGKLNQAFKDDDEALVQVVPNVRAFRGVMNVLSQDASVVSSVMEGVAADIDVLSIGMKELEKTIGFKTKRAVEALKNSFLELGDELIPVWEVVTEKVTGFANAVRDIPPETKRMAITTVGYIGGGGIMMSALGRLSTGMSKLIGFFRALGPAGTVMVGAGLGIAHVANEYRKFTNQLERTGREQKEHTATLERSAEGGKAAMAVFSEYQHDLGGMEVALKALARQTVFNMRDVAGLTAGIQAQIDLGNLFELSGQRMIYILEQAGIAATKERDILIQVNRRFSDLVRSFETADHAGDNLTVSMQLLNEELDSLPQPMVEISTEFDVMISKGPPVLNAVSHVNTALKTMGIELPNVSKEMGVLRRLAIGLKPEMESLGVTQEIVADEAQKLYDEYAALGILTPELRNELMALGATTKELADETKTGAEAWGEFFATIKTGITWVDTLVQGIFKLIDSLMKGDGLKGALGGIGDMISGVFGGTGSKTGQVVGGIVSKLGGFDFSSLLGGLFGGGKGGSPTASLTGEKGVNFLTSLTGLTAGKLGLSNIVGAAGGGLAATGGMASILGFMGGPYGMAAMAMISAFGPQIMDGLKQLGGFVKGLFGPDDAELDARRIKASVNDLFDSVMDAQQKIEAGGVQWKMNNIVVRDSYLAIGKSQAEADAAMKRLADTSKQTPAQAQATVDAIVKVVEEVKAQMLETGLGMTELRNKNINAAIVAAEAAKKAMTDTATAAKDSATQVSGAFKEAFDSAATAAQSSATKVKESFGNSLNAVKDAAASTVEKVNEKFQGIDISTPIEKFNAVVMGDASAGGAVAYAGAGGGNGGPSWDDPNALRLESLMERLPIIMERAVKHGLQTTGRRVRN